MDRDMVNSLHYLYQWGEISATQLQEKKIFWCDPDTRQPLQGRRIVVDDVRTGSVKLAEGVYDLIDMIEDQLRSMPKPDYAFGYPISAAIRPPNSLRPAFLAISYAPQFDPIKQAVRDAAVSAGFDCEVTGDLGTPGDIMDQVWRGIRGADVMVADVTGKNANVFYELGLAHALGKEVIILSQEQEAPFDIRSSRRITYDIADIRALQTNLASAFHSISARYPHECRGPRF